MAEASNEEGKPDESPLFAFTKKDKKDAAKDFNSRRAAYNRQLTWLRKHYFDEITRERAEEEARLEAEQKELTRRRLERQRIKNVRSAQNALLEEQKRRTGALEFEEYLRQKQGERDERKRRYNRAREMVLSDLEAEAHLWLTTPEEVEAAFTHQAEQMLWARPNGVLGSPSPSYDSQFWQYETHTMHMDKTYKTQRQVLLEELLERIYEEAMVDPKFWTPERIKEYEALEDKAKLRAMVRAEGRRALLEKQKQMLEEYFGTREDQVPKKMPAPNVKILANIDAQENEGVELLLKDPTRFFRFENQGETGRALDDGVIYSGPTLGAPVGLRDELRDGNPWTGVFPVGIAKIPKDDVRTQREKKRQEREQKMWEATQTEKNSSEGAAIDMAAKDDVIMADEIDYNDNEWDSDDEAWEQGLDPIEDADILNTPPDRRYSEEDIRWVIGQLEIQSHYLHSQMNREIESTRQRLVTQKDVENETQEEKEMQELLLSLTNEQMLALVEVDAQNLQAMSPDELSDALSKVPGLEADQVKRILELDDSLSGSQLESGSKQPNDS